MRILLFCLMLISCTPHQHLKSYPDLIILAGPELKWSQDPLGIYADNVFLPDSISFFGKTNIIVGGVTFIFKNGNWEREGHNHLDQFIRDTCSGCRVR